MRLATTSIMLSFLFHGDRLEGALAMRGERSDPVPSHVALRLFSTCTGMFFFTAGKWWRVQHLGAKVSQLRRLFKADDFHRNASGQMRDRWS